MLITYRNHPVLEKLKNGKLGKLDIPPEYNYDFERDRKVLSILWDMHSKNFKTRLVRFSKAFYDACDKAESSILRMGQNLWDIAVEKPQSGTVLDKEYAICYDMRFSSNGYVYTLFIFYKNRLIVHGTCINGHTKVWVDKIYYGEDVDEEKLWYTAVSQIVLQLNFLKYAPIEIKTIGANKKVKDIHGKYCNQTDLDIDLIDSTWFTTLVKSDGFKVRGHFRLQPHGPGLTEKRLIWINDFEKQGYVRNFKRPINIDD